MTTEVRVPALGESVTEATVATWFKKPGDAVAVDEILCELETDKVSLDVPSPVAGVLAEIVWCQEEPRNQGAYTYIEPNLEWVLTRIGAKHSRAVYAGRDASASPATGLASKHKAQQEALVNDALTFKGN